MVRTWLSYLYYISIAIIVFSIIIPPSMGLSGEGGEHTNSQVGESSSTNVSVVSLPTEELQFRRGGYQTENYVLSIPDAQVRIHSVNGTAILNYKINIPELSYMRSTIYSIRSQDDGRNMLLSMTKDTFEKDELANDTYQGSISVVVNEGETSRTIKEKNVTISVEN